MGAVDDAVEDGIADRRIADQFVPARHGDLAGHQQRALLVPVIDDLQQISPLLGGQRFRTQSSIISSLVRSSIASIRGSLPSPRAVASSANSRGARR